MVLFAVLLLLVASCSAQDTPGGTRACLDKGCWGMEANRYSDLPGAQEKYNEDAYAVADCTPYIPKDLCSHCVLNIKNVAEAAGACNGRGQAGDFINCGRMFEIDSDECRGALEVMSKHTPCDAQLEEAIRQYYVDNPDNYNYQKDKYGQLLDRYVYTFCEECCDCIPCGSEPEDINDPSATHIDPMRHNCPLHWLADVCNLYPNIMYYADFPHIFYDSSFDTGSSAAAAAATLPSIESDDSDVLSEPAPGPVSPAPSPEDYQHYEPSLAPGLDLFSAPTPGPSMEFPPSPPPASGGFSFFGFDFGRKLLSSEEEELCLGDDGMCEVSDTAARKLAADEGAGLTVNDALNCFDGRVDENNERKPCDFKPIDVCKLTRRYRRYDAAGQQDKVDQVYDNMGLRKSLDYYLRAWGCYEPKAWVPCREMEDRQGRMDPAHMNC